MDLNTYFKNSFIEGNSSKILILGCGISDHETSNNIGECIYYITKFKNLKISDKNLNGINHHFEDGSDLRIDFNYKNETEFKELFPISYGNINKYNHFQYKNIITLEMINERFISLDLTLSDFSELDCYDYIKLRWVLHFITKDRRDFIIDQLYQKLNIGGSIGIQNYIKKPDNNLNNEYILYDEDEINKLKERYNAEVFYNEESKNNEKYFTMLITKKL